MAQIKCVNGHYYDNAEYSVCPLCASQAGAQRFGITADVLMDEKTCLLRTMPEDATISFNAIADKDFEKTMNFTTSTLKSDPVVGWLVCVSGPEKGRDYRLRTGRNFIGRSGKSNVNIVEDMKISRENHASLIFEPRNQRFMLMLGSGGYTAVNDRAVLDIADLNDGDRITLGDSTFEVCPHCDYVYGTPPQSLYRLVPGTLLNGRYTIGRVMLPCRVTRALNMRRTIHQRRSKPQLRRL